jgi:hypothetical protein
MYECVCAIVGRRLALPQPQSAPQEKGPARSIGDVPRRPPARAPPAPAAPGMSSRCDRSLSPPTPEPSHPLSKPIIALSHRTIFYFVSRRSREKSCRPSQGHRQGDHGQLDAPDRISSPASHQELRRQIRPAHTGKMLKFQLSNSKELQTHNFYS